MTAPEKFRYVMREFKNKDLTHGTTGETVTDRDMALAIAFSEAQKIEPSYGRYRCGGKVLASGGALMDKYGSCGCYPMGDKLTFEFDTKRGADAMAQDYDIATVIDGGTYYVDIDRDAYEEGGGIPFSEIPRPINEDEIIWVADNNKYKWKKIDGVWTPVMAEGGEIDKFKGENLYTVEFTPAEDNENSYGTGMLRADSIDEAKTKWESLKENKGDKVQVVKNERTGELKIFSNGGQTWTDRVIVDKEYAEPFKKAFMALGYDWDSFDEQERYSYIHFGLTKEQLDKATGAGLIEKYAEEIEEYGKGGQVDDDIIHIYKQRNNKKAEILNSLSFPYKEAYGSIYINIDDVLTEEGTPELKHEWKGGYGGVNFLGNINGKSPNDLYFKNEDVMNEFYGLRRSLSNLSEETKDAIDFVRKQKGEPKNQLGILSAKASGMFEKGGEITYKVSVRKMGSNLADYGSEYVDRPTTTIESEEANTRSEAMKIKRRLKKKYDMISHAGNTVNYKKQLEIITNFEKGGSTDKNWMQGAVKEMEKKGTVGLFTKKAEKHGMSTVRFAKDVLDNPTMYDLKTRREAQFMKNANPDLFADGGKIENQYAGKSVDEVWNSWTEEQRIHFIKDHFPSLEARDRVLIPRRDFKDLDKLVVRALHNHVKGGQYADGGSTKKKNKRFGVFTGGHFIGEVVYAQDIYDLINNKMPKRMSNWEVIKYKDDEEQTVKVTKYFMDDDNMTIQEVIDDYYAYATDEDLNEDIAVLDPKNRQQFGHPKTVKGWKLHEEGGEVSGYDIDEVLRHFIMALLWASDYDGEPLEDNYSEDNIPNETKEQIKKGIVKFIKENNAILKKHNIAADSLGHDLFLTSQGHGAGFWDRGYGDDGDTLSNAAKKYFEADSPVVDDDGMIEYRFYTKTLENQSFVGEVDRNQEMLPRLKKELEESKKYLASIKDLDDYEFVQGNEHIGSFNSKLELKDSIKQLEKDIEKLEGEMKNYAKGGSTNKGKGEIKVGDDVYWKVPLYDDFIYYNAKVLKIFKNGKARIEYKSGYGEGKPQRTNTPLSTLSKEFKSFGKGGYTKKADGGVIGEKNEDLAYHNVAVKGKDGKLYYILFMGFDTWNYEPEDGYQTIMWMAEDGEFLDEFPDDRYRKVLDLVHPDSMQTANDFLFDVTRNYVMEKGGSTTSVKGWEIFNGNEIEIIDSPTEFYDDESLSHTPVISIEDAVKEAKAMGYNVEKGKGVSGNDTYLITNMDKFGKGGSTKKNKYKIVVKRTGDKSPSATAIVEGVSEQDIKDRYPTMEFKELQTNFKQEDFEGADIVKITKLVPDSDWRWFKEYGSSYAVKDGYLVQSPEENPKGFKDVILVGGNVDGVDKEFKAKMKKAFGDVQYEMYLEQGALIPLDYENKLDALWTSLTSDEQTALEPIFNRITNEIDNPKATMEDIEKSYNKGIADIEKEKSKLSKGGQTKKKKQAKGGMLDTIKIKDKMVGNEISQADLAKICGHKPKYPRQEVGKMVFEKCFMKPYYRLVKK